MGSIRPKGKAWEIRYYAGTDANGRPRRLSTSFHGSYRAAEAEMHYLEGGRAPKPKEITFAQVLEAWVAHGGRRSEASQARVARRVRTHIIPALGHHAASAISPSILEGFYRQALRELAPGTVRNLHWDISGALRRATRDGIVAHNAAERVELHLGSPERIEVPTLEAVAALLAAVDAGRSPGDRELAIAIRVCLSTGARRGEMCGMQWRDVHFDRHVIHLCRNTVRLPRGVVILAEPKKGSRRWVAMPEAVTKALEAHRGDAGPEHHVLGGQERPWAPERLTQHFSRWRERVGVSFRFHDLRHLHASVALESGVPIPVVSAGLGHSRTSTTTDTYGHLLEPGVDHRSAQAISRRIEL